MALDSEVAPQKNPNITSLSKLVAWNSDPKEMGVHILGYWHTTPEKQNVWELTLSMLKYDNIKWLWWWMDYYALIKMSKSRKG